MHFRKAFIATALAIAPVWAGGKSVNVYWGQHGTDTLESACESDGFEYITLGFINSSPENGNGTGYPGDNFAGHCWAETYSNNGRQSKLYTTCKSIQTGISKCQDNGKKVLLSIGGEYTADSNYTVSNAAKGREFAYFMWNAFGPYNSSWTGPRPFDDPDSGTKNVVDGYDFDIEYPFADETGYVAMINQLRSYISDARRTDVITGAPQCPLQNADVDMEYMLNHAQFDLLFIQFYNNEQCNALKSDGTINPNFNYAQWESYLKTTPNNATKLFIGLPGSSAAATSGYINLASAKTLLCTYKDYPHFGGAMIWDQYYGLENSNILTGKAYYESIHDILNGGCDGSATTTIASTTTSASSSAACATTPANVQSGVTANCVEFYEVQAGQTCQIIADKFGITLAEFYIWNPDVGTDCSNLWADEYYCVAVGVNSCPATTTTATSAFSSTSSSVITTSSAYSTSSIYSASSSSYSASSSSYSSSSSAAQTTSLSSSESISQSASQSSASSVQSFDPTTTPSVSQTSASSTDTSDIISSTASASQTSPSSSETYDPTGTSTSAFVSSTASATQTSVSSTETDDCDEPTGTSTSDVISSTASVTQTSASSTETDDCDEPTDTSSSSVVVSTSVSVSATSTETAVSSTEAVSSTSGVSTQVTSSSSSASSATEGLTSSGSAYPTSSTEVSVSSSSIPVSSTPYPNGTITSATQGPTSSSEIWTTSTLYTTTVYTVTSCAPTVTNCPAKGYVTTEVIAYTTTVCPVTESQAAPTTTSAPAPVSYFTSTVYTTTVYTITSCPAAVPNCPAKGSATTEVIPVSTTVIPVVEVSVTVIPVKEESTTTTTQKTFIYSTITVPKPIATGVVVNPGTNVTLPSGSGYSYSIPSPSATTASSGSSGCTGPSCPATTTSVVTAGAGRNAVALAVPALLAAIALAL